MWVRQYSSDTYVRQDELGKLNGRRQTLISFQKRDKIFSELIIQKENETYGY